MGDSYLKLKREISLGVCFVFLINSLMVVPLAQASTGGSDFRLPAPGVMVHLSPPLNPPILKGIKVYSDNPFRFDFILDQGDSLEGTALEGTVPSTLFNKGLSPLRQESLKLIKYFLASITIPEKDLWVNLSPYEKDRIIPQGFGLTEMGRDLLAEDYMLKQITASLIYPEEVGKRFWKRIYEEAAKKFGTTNLTVNTFNKVWIVPERAVVYENAKAGTAYVVESRLKVMLEQDYVSLQKHEGIRVEVKNTNQLGSKIVREIVIPQLTKEVNENKNFDKLRQVYNSLILATWYKKKIKDSILSQVYADKNKTAGVQYTSSVIPPRSAEPKFKNDVEGVYREYLEAFKKGVYNYIKEEQDPLTQEIIPRKYFSGGAVFDSAALAKAEVFTSNAAVLPKGPMDSAMVITAKIAPLFKRKTNFERVQDMINEIGAKESVYSDRIRSLYDVLQDAPQEAFHVMEKLENDYRELLKVVHSFSRSRALRNAPAAVNVFVRYTRTMEEIHRVVMGHLALIADFNWPRSKQDTSAYKDNHERAQKIWESGGWESWGWESWGNEKKLSPLLGLKKHYDEIQESEEKTTLHAKINVLLRDLLLDIRSKAQDRLAHGRFKMAVYKKALAQEIRIDAEFERHIEATLGIDWEPKDYQRLQEEGNVFYQAAKDMSLPQAIAVGLLTPKHIIEWQHLLGETFGKSLRRRMTIKRFMSGVVLAVLVSIFSVIPFRGTPQEPTVSLSGRGQPISADTRPVSPPLASDSKASQIIVDRITDSSPMALKEVAESIRKELDKKAREQRDNIQKQLREHEKYFQKQKNIRDKMDHEMDQKFKEVSRVIGQKPRVKETAQPPLMPQQWHQSASRANNEKTDWPNKVASSPEFHVPGYSLTQGVTPEQYARIKSRWVANVHGPFGYLSEATYTLFDPITGIFFPRPVDIKKWTLSGESSNEFIDIPSNGEKDLLVPVPPDYKIVNVLTEKKTNGTNVFFDKANQTWHISFDTNPGLVRVMVKQAAKGELGTIPQLEMVDAKGRLISKEYVEAQLKENLPPALWDFIQSYRQSHDDASPDQRRFILDKLMAYGWFYYTTNSSLRDASFGHGHSVLESIFEYYAAKCDGFSAIRIILSYLLGLQGDISYQSGYGLRGTTVSMADQHGWTMEHGRIVESTKSAGKISPLHEREGVTRSDEEREKEFFKKVWAPSIRSRMPLDLKAINGELKTQDLKEELARAAAEVEVKDHEAASSSEKEQKHIQEYYLQLTQDYYQRLQELKSSGVCATKAKELLKKIGTFIPSFADPYQYMAFNTYVLQILNMIQEAKGKVFVQATREVYEGKIAAYLEAKGWNNDALYEPLPYPMILGFVVRKDLTHLVIANINNQRYIIDALTGERIKIPQGFDLVDFVHGLYLVKNGSSYRIVGPRALIDRQSTQFLQERHVFNSVEILHSILKGDDWVGTAFLSEGLYFFGPAAEKEGVDRKLYTLDSKVVQHEGNILFMLRRGHGDPFHYVGSLARKLGIDNVVGMNNVEGLINSYDKLDNGKIVVAVHSRRGVGFYGDGVPQELKGLYFFKTTHFYSFNNGRWIARVLDFQSKERVVGNIQDQDILGSDPALWKWGPSTSPSGALYTLTKTRNGKDRLIGEWVKSVDWTAILPGHVKGAAVEFDSINRPVFLDNQGRKFLMKIGRKDENGQMVYSWVGTEQQALPLLRPDMDLLTVRTCENGLWMALLRSGESRWGAFLSESGMSFEESVLEDGFTLFNDGTFLFRHLDAGKKYFRGSWARKHHVDQDSHATDAYIEFLEKGKQIDPNHFIIIDYDEDGNHSAAGPIAEQLGIKGKKFFALKAYTLNDGNVMVEFKESEDSPLESRATAGPDKVFRPHKYSSHLAVLNLGGRSYKEIPPQRLDLRVEYLRQCPLEMFHDSFISVLDRMIENRDKDKRYVNPKEIEKMFHERMPEIVKYVMGDDDDKKASQDGREPPAKIKHIYTALSNYGLGYLIVDVMHEAVKDHKVSGLAGLLRDELLKIVSAYEENLAQQIGLDPQITAVYLSPLGYDDTEKIVQAVNRVVTTVASAQEQYKIERYAKHLKAVKAGDLSKETFNSASAYPRQVQKALDFARQRLKGVPYPFDVQLHGGEKANPLFLIPRILASNAAFFKIGTETQRQYRQWKEINGALNRANAAVPSTVSFSFSDFLRSIEHDTLALALVVGLLAFLLSKKSLWLRQKDRIIGRSAADVFDQMWDKNPWFKGEGFGGVEGAREVIRRILFEGLSDSDKEQLQRLRHGYNERQNAIIDAILALAADSPQEAVTSVYKRLLYLVPFIGIFLVRDPKAFRQRQEMNDRLRKVLTDIGEGEKAEDVLQRVLKVTESYGSPYFQVRPLEERLSFEDFSAKVQALARSESSVRTDNQEVFSKRHNGSVSRRQGSGMEFDGYRPYAEGDDIRLIDWNASARLGQTLVKATRADKEVNVTIMINIAELVTGQREAIQDFINSIKVLFPKTRQTATKGKGLYQIKQVLLIMPHGDVIELQPPSRYTNHVQLIKHLLKAIEASYRQASLFLEQQNIFVPNFYNPGEKERYKEINELRSANEAIAQQKAQQLLLRQHPGLGDNVFLVGLEQSAKKKMASLLAGRARVYAWKWATASVIRGDRAQAAVPVISEVKSVSDTGGIDLTEANKYLQTQNAGEGIKVYANPIMLKSLQDAPGFVPIVINIQPLTNLRRFLEVDG